KEHTYLEIEEQVIAYVMHHNWGKIWVPDCNTKPKKKSKEAKEGIQLYHWYNEKKMKAERIESLIGFGPDADVEYRTIPIMDQGVIVGMKTEKYFYNESESKIEVLSEETRMFPK